MAIAPASGASRPLRAHSLLLVAALWTLAEAAGSTSETVTSSPSEETAASSTSKSAGSRTAGEAEETAPSLASVETGSSSPSTAEETTASTTLAKTASPRARRAEDTPASSTRSKPARPIARRTEAVSENGLCTEQGESTLEDLLKLLARAHDLSVDQATLTKVESVVNTFALADLTLLCELMSLGDHSLVNLPGPVKTALTSSTVDVNRILLVFKNARLAGLPEAEIAAAMTARDTEVKSHLTAAIAAVQADRTSTATTAAKWTAESMESLARAISLAVALELQDPLVDEAKAAFHAGLVGDFTAADMDYIERVVAKAEIAQATVPALINRWAMEMPHLRIATELPKDSVDSLPQFLKVVGESRELGLPAGVPEMVVVLENAQHCAMLNVNLTLASQDHCDTGFLDTLVMALRHAELLEVSSASLARAKTRATTCATTELSAAVLDVHDVVRIKEAFRWAAQLGLPELDRTTAWELVATEVKALLSAAKTAATSGASSRRLTRTNATRRLTGTDVEEATETASTAATAGKLTQTHVEELAEAIRVASYLGVDETGVEAARATYAGLMLGPFDLSNPNPFEALVDLADAAGVSVSVQLRSQRAALKVAREALELQDCEPGNTESFLEVIKAFREVVGSQVSDFPSAVAIRAAAQDCASTKLADTSVSEGLDAYLDLLSVCTEVGVPALSLASATADAKTFAKDLLEQRVKASPIDIDDVRAAITDAQLAGVNASFIDSAKHDIHTVSSTGLKSSTSALQANRTAATMEAAGRAVNFASKLEEVRQALSSEIEAARALYTQRLNEPFTGASLALLEASVIYADWAEASVPQSVLQLRGTMRKLHDLAEQTSHFTPQDLEEVMTLLFENPDIHNSDQEKLQALVREALKAQLDAAVEDPTLEALYQAVQTVLAAGLSEQNLNKGLSVANALGSSR